MTIACQMRNSVAKIFEKARIGTLGYPVHYTVL